MSHSDAGRAPRVRFAPSPTGELHVGNAYVTLFNYAFARSRGGTFILRIEDTDQVRSTKAFEEGIIRSLKWLGLHWDEGPDVGGECGPYRQSERQELYAKHAGQLLETGHAFRCFCTPERLTQMRQAQQQRKQPTGYDGKCRSLSAEDVKRRIAEGESHVIRLKVPKDLETRFDDRIRGTIRIHNREVDDQVLIKSDGFPTYHLANVVDDHSMGITHVIRAEEWITSTPKHILLYEAFGWEPPEFVHMPLLRNPDKSKLSKRKNPVSVDHYRAAGFLPEALVNMLCLMGYSGPGGEEVFTLDQMIEDFSWDKVNTSAPIFDMTKLEWLNGVYIRNMDRDNLVERLRQSGSLIDKCDDVFMEKMFPLVQERMRKLADFDELCEFFFTEQLEYPASLLVVKKRTREEARGALEASLRVLDAVKSWACEDMEKEMRSLASELGWKAGELFMTLRIAVTGKKATPPLFESMDVLGREKSLARIRKAIEVVNTSGN